MPGPFDDLIPANKAPAPAMATPGFIPGTPKPEKPREAPSGYTYNGGALVPIPGGPADPNVKPPPSGYMYDAAGGLKPIPGGPADSTSPTADATEAQSKIATLTTRIAGGLSDITGVLKDAPDAAGPGFVEGLRGNLAPGGITGMISRSMAGAPRRAVVDTQRDVLDALLTLGTGAAYAQEQLDAAVAAHFPQYGDSPDEIKLKNQRFERAVASAKANAGPAWLRVEPLIQPYLQSLSVSGGEQPAANTDDVLKAKFPDAARFLRSNGEVVGYEDANGEFVAIVDNGPQDGGPDGGGGGGLGDALYAGVGDVAEAVGDTLGYVGNPLNAGINAVAGTNLSTDLGQTFRDATGAPQGNEMAGAINRAGTSALTFTGAANALQPVAQGATKLVTNALASQPAQQFVGALTGGASAEGARQAGAPVPVQIAAGIAGGGAGFSGSNAMLRGGQTAPNTMQASERLIPNARQVVQDGKAANVRVMTSDIRPPSTRTGKLARTVGENIPFAGTAGPRAAQQNERTDAVQRLMKEFGADDAAVDAVSKDLVKTRGAMIGKLKAAKDSVIDNISGAVTAPKAVAEIDKQIANLKGIDDVAFKPVIDRLNGFKTALQSGKTLKQVEGQRRLLGDLFSDPSLASIKSDGQKALNAIYNPLRDDMAAFIEASAGPAAKAKWAGANDRLSAMAGELDASAFKNLLNKAETTPESASKILFGKTPSDMKRLYGSLSDKGRTKAQAAIMFQAAEKSTTNDIISPQKFATAMEAMSKATGVFFSPADKARIDGMTRLIKATQQASDAAANPMTGAQNTPLIAGLSIGQIFGTAALPATAAAGLLARAYESGPVRDAFLRLGRTKPGSPQESAMIPKVMSALAASNDNGADYMRSAPGLSQAAASEDVNKERPIQP